MHPDCLSTQWLQMFSLLIFFPARPPPPKVVRTYRRNSSYLRSKMSGTAEATHCPALVFQPERLLILEQGLLSKPPLGVRRGV